MTLSAGAVLTGCSGDETVAAYGAADRLWQLESLDGAAFPASATLEFGEGGAISGTTPCNLYSGRQTVPYPWFAVERIVTTRRACPDLAAERAYLDALQEMTLSEVAGPVLRLENDAGREMIFRAAGTSP